MTGKQRVMAAVNHRLADRTAITFDAEKEVYAALRQRFGVETKEALFDRLHVDTWVVGPKHLQEDPARPRPEGVGIWGYQTRMVAYEGGSYGELCYSPLAGKDELADIGRHKWPGPGAMSFAHFPEEIRTHQERAIIGCFTWGAYFLATYIRGTENLLLDFALRKDYAALLIETIAERCRGYLETMLDNYGDGIDIVYMADDYCSQLAPMFSPENFREFVMPYLKRMVETVHRHDKKFLLHCCGAVRPLLPQIIEAGVDMLEPIQVRAEGMEPEGLKRDFGRDLCFYGGVDLQDVLRSSNPARVADEVRRLIDILGRDGGYILGPGHTYIQVDAPVENIVTMYDTAEQYRPWRV